MTPTVFRHPVYLILALTWLAPTAIAVPNLLFPINSQFPPVARVSQYFSFVFSASTFASDGSPLQYRLEGAPLWLQFDGEARLLHGIPAFADVGEIPLKLHVLDGTGHLDHEFKLVVSADAAPAVGNPMGVQIPEIGNTDALGSLVLAQGQKFNFSFANDTFYGTDNVKRYNAVCSNNTPLPSWINFDWTMLRFYGEAPLLESPSTPPHRFGLKIIAEDILNFESSSAAFELVVNHHLTVVQPEIRVNVTIGMVLYYRIPLEEILLDSKPIQLSYIRNITISVSEWLHFRRADLAITGSTVFEPKSESIALTIHDIYDNKAELNVTVRASWADVFTKDLDDVSAIRGSKFDYSLNYTIFNHSDFDISVRYTPDVDWILFDPESLTLNGDVPPEANNVQVEILAENTASGHRESRTFDVVIKDPNVGDGQETSGIDIGATHQSQSGSKLKLILLSTLLPLAGVILLLLCVSCRKRCIYRLRRGKPGKRSGTPTCDMISRPIHTDSNSEPWPVAMISKNETKYTPVVERGYTGPGFVGVAPTTNKHTKDNSIGSELLMGVGTTGIGSAITTDDDSYTPRGSFGDMPRRLTSIPMLTKIVSGEPLKVSPAKNGISKQDNKNWAPLRTDSGDSMTGEAIASSTRKSWRRTIMWAQRGGPRDSDATVDTVSTAEVFSVRLVGSPVMIGDQTDTKLWETRGLRKGESSKATINGPLDEQRKEQKERHVYFGDEWEVTELPTPEHQHYIPRPSPRATRRSLQRYRDSGTSFGSEPFDDFSFAATAAPPIVSSAHGGSVWTALVQGKVRDIGAGLLSMNEERQKPKVDVKKGQAAGRTNGKAYGWPF